MCKWGGGQAALPTVESRYDVGSWHQINVLTIDDTVPKCKYPKVVKRVGKSPPQYMDEEE